MKQEPICGFAAVCQISLPAPELGVVMTPHATCQRKYYLKYESLEKHEEDAQNKEEVVWLTVLPLSLAWLM